MNLASGTPSRRLLSTWAASSCKPPGILQRCERCLGPAGGRPGKRKRLYDDHKTQTEITAGIKSGTFHQVQCLMPSSRKLRGTEQPRLLLQGTPLKPLPGSPTALSQMP